MRKPLILGKLKARGEDDDRGRDGWMALPIQWTISLSKAWEMVKGREAWLSAVDGVEKSWPPQSGWTTIQTHTFHRSTLTGFGTFEQSCYCCKPFFVPNLFGLAVPPPAWCNEWEGWSFRPEQMPVVPPPPTPHPTKPAVARNSTLGPGYQAWDSPRSPKGSSEDVQSSRGSRKRTTSKREGAF